MKNFVWFTLGFIFALWLCDIDVRVHQVHTYQHTFKFPDGDYEHTEEEEQTL